MEIEVDNANSTEDINTHVQLSSVHVPIEIATSEWHTWGIT